MAIKPSAMTTPRKRPKLPRGSDRAVTMREPRLIWEEEAKVGEEGMAEARPMPTMMARVKEVVRPRRVRRNSAGRDVDAG